MTNWIVKKRKKRTRKEIINVIETILLPQFSNSENDDFEELITTLNFAIFSYIIELDLSSIESLLLNKSDKWTRTLIIRNLVLILYESRNDFSEFFGRKHPSGAKQNELIQSLSSIEELEKIRKEFRKAFGIFEQDFSEILKNIRHKCLGHRDHNSKTQYECISKIDEDLILNQILPEFRALLNIINTSYHKILAESLLVGLEKELIERKKRLNLMEGS
ncbi:MAG: hypothetical protein AB8B74_14120 [Crocinitomicaceae bacterium]